MSAEEQQLTYKVTITGPGHTFEREINEVTATKLITIAVSGKVDGAGGGSNRASGANGSDASTADEARPPVRGSLASHIKAKKAEKNQVLRFLATAQWVSSRDD